MKKPATPFTTTGYYGPEYFCNREEETQNLLRNIKSGQSTILVSLRRIGKTGLIKHTLNQLPKGRLGIYIDILPTENLNGFLNAMASAIVNAIPEKSGLGVKIWKIIKSLRPTITYNPLSGIPEVSFDMKQQETELQIDSLLKFLDQQESRVLIAIDEFQQILGYPESNTDAWLRSIMQQLNNVVFIFSGSQQHLMTKLFTTPSKPFFRSAQFMKLNKIDASKYNRFILKKFKGEKITITPEIVNEMLQWADLHTYYVQLLCNRVYTSGKTQITTSIWQDEAYKLLKEQEAVFYNYRHLLTKPQWQLLKAIAMEGTLYSPTAKDFILKYMLGSPATILRSLKSLSKSEMIYSEIDQNGRNYYRIYDILFMRWIQGS